MRKLLYAGCLSGLLITLTISACLPLDITLPGNISIGSLADLEREFDLPMIRINRSEGTILPQKLCAHPDGDTIQGSGIERTETRPVEEVTALVLAGLGKIVLRQDVQESLVIKADENILPYLETRINDGRLWLETAEGVCIQPSDIGITYFVSLNELNLLRIIGAGSIEAESFQTATLSIELDGTGLIDLAGLQVGELETGFNGTGQIQLAGVADKQYLSLNGVGQYQAAELRTDSVRIKLNGTGGVEVWAVSDLMVELNGMGTVRYIGEPDITQTTSGLAGIEPIRGK